MMSLFYSSLAFKGYSMPPGITGGHSRAHRLCLTLFKASGGPTANGKSLETFDAIGFRSSPLPHSSMPSTSSYAWNENHRYLGLFSPIFAKLIQSKLKVFSKLKNQLKQITNLN